MSTNTLMTPGTYQQGTDRVWKRTECAKFTYSDGDSNENRLLEALRNCKDVGLFSPEIAAYQVDWPSFYHLTPLRANLLRPFYEQIKSGSVLELGAGCGAVTRFLGETGASVVALEGSARRASIIAERCRDLPNVEIVTDLIQSFETTHKFDIVTLIGVLEYAQVYVEAPDPIDHLLRVAKSFLAPNGTLILAIENQLGLKYFCGAPEDHLGRPMYGVNDSYTKKTAITFGRKELEQRIRSAGFKYIDLYVPAPDYKTPVSIIYPHGFSNESEVAGFDPSPILAGAVVHDRQRPKASTFSLENAWQVIGRNGLAQDMANSFLFAISDGPLETTQHILAAHYGGQRPAEFSKETQFVLSEGSLGTQTRPTANTHQLHKMQWEISPYRSGRLWFDELLVIINRPGWTLADISDWANTWLDALRLQPSASKENAIPELQHFAQLLAPKYIDASPTNLIVSNTGRPNFFDLEWNFSTALPIEFIVFRGLFLTLHRVTTCARPSAGTPNKIFDVTIAIMMQHDMVLDSDDLDLFIALFNTFQNQAQGLPPTALNGLTQALETAVLPVRQLFT